METTTGERERHRRRASRQLDHVCWLLDGGLPEVDPGRCTAPCRGWDQPTLDHWAAVGAQHNRSAARTKPFPWIA